MACHQQGLGDAHSRYVPSAVVTRMPSTSLTSASGLTRRTVISWTMANLRSLGSLKRASDVLTVRQGIAHRRQAVVAAGNDIYQPERVVIAIVAVGEKNVAARVAGEWRLQFGHSGLDDGMAGGAHQRLAGVACDLVE